MKHTYVVLHQEWVGDMKENTLPEKIENTLKRVCQSTHRYLEVCPPPEEEYEQRFVQSFCAQYSEEAYAICIDLGLQPSDEIDAIVKLIDVLQSQTISLN